MDGSHVDGAPGSCVPASGKEGEVLDPTELPAGAVQALLAVPWGRLGLAGTVKSSSQVQGRALIFSSAQITFVRLLRAPLPWPFSRSCSVKWV